MAGVDCIDLSADPAVVAAAKEGVDSGYKVMERRGQANFVKPFLMISVNDDEDPHFRKAYFDPIRCPSDCPRPCEKVCPAFAIPSLQSLHDAQNGVVASKCYGCGRCVPVCPLGLIQTESYTVPKETINKLFQSESVDAIEIHTQPNHQSTFADLWSDIGHDVLSRAKVVAVSFPDMGEETLPYLEDLQTIMSSHPEWKSFTGVNIWQTDGRPMSGDIGKGTAHKSSNLAAVLLDQIKSRENLPYQEGLKTETRNQIDITTGRHYLQLAGGTNDYSAKTARDEELIGAQGFGGFAFGGYARKGLVRLLQNLEDQHVGAKIEEHPQVLEDCLTFANRLVSTVKI
jgi:Fe-S-cluster-containing hydrogenase component 2